MENCRIFQKIADGFCKLCERMEILSELVEIGTGFERMKVQIVTRK